MRPEIVEAESIRKVYHSYRAICEGGKPACGLHFPKRVAFSIGMARYDVCVKCGAVRIDTFNGPEEMMDYETVGFINPRAEAVK